MNYIKYYWFNILIALIIIFGMIFTLIVALSPKEDNLKRGFIPCTEILADTISSCNGKIWCATKAVLNNSLCNAKIITKGFRLWINNKQPTPWSNYLFTPDLTPNQNSLYENSELFYQENPNFQQDFQKLKQDYHQLEKETTHEEKSK